MVREPRDPTGSEPMKVIRPLVLRGARHVLRALSDAICRAKDACVQACRSAARRRQLRDPIKTVQVPCLAAECTLQGSISSQELMWFSHTCCPDLYAL